MASAVRIGLAGIALIRARPRAVLAWGFVQLVFAIVVSLLTQPMIERMLLAMPRPGETDAMAAMDWSLVGPVLLANLGIYGALLILLAAAMRAMLKPAEQGAFFIRVGRDELRLLGLLIILIFVMLVVYTITLIIAGILGAIVVAAFSAAGGGQVAAITIVSLLILIELALLLTVQVRLALALPLTIMRKRIVLREAWRRSRSHFWGLFGGFALSGLAVGAVSLCLTMPILLPLVESRTAGGFIDPAAQLAAMRSPWTYPLWLLMPLVSGFFIAMAGGALGQAVLETEPASS